MIIIFLYSIMVTMIHQNAFSCINLCKRLAYCIIASSHQNSCKQSNIFLKVRKKNITIGLGTLPFIRNQQSGIHTLTCNVILNIIKLSKQGKPYHSVRWRHICLMKCKAEFFMFNITSNKKVRRKQSYRFNIQLNNEGINDTLGIRHVYVIFYNKKENYIFLYSWLIIKKLQY